MSDKPETIAAVLAALRRYADIVELGPPPIGKAFADLFREYADRIEAAAKRYNHCEKRFDEDGNEMPPHCAFQSLRLDHALAENDALRAALVEISQMCGVGPNEVSAITIAYICDKALKTKGE